MWAFIGGAVLGCFVGISVMAMCTISGWQSDAEEAAAIRTILASSEKLKEATDE